MAHPDPIPRRSPTALADYAAYAAYVAYAGGAVAAAGALAVGVLAGQALIARRMIPGAEAPPPRSGGDYGLEYAGAPVLNLAVLGDSTAAGYGVTTRADTPGAHLSTWIARATGRPVHLVCPAVVGAVSAWLAPQVETAIEAGAELAIIFIGANDVTTRAGESIAVRHLYEAVRTLRRAGAEVVVATCPDLGTILPIPQPLRWFARRWSRQLAAAQTVAVVEAGGRSVSLGDLLGPEFAAAPERLFGIDNYHPSAEGYRLAAAAVLPAALMALRVAGRAEAVPGGPGAGPLERGGSEPDADPGRAFRSSVRSLPAAAATAARHAGSEVSGVAVGGAERGPAGRWAQLRQRVWRVVPGWTGVARVNGEAVPCLAGQNDVARPEGAPLTAESH
jgi:lysophospholipase L1-like esterase